jgi:hypothetical protein
MSVRLRINGADGAAALDLYGDSGSSYLSLIISMISVTKMRTTYVNSYELSSLLKYLFPLFLSSLNIFGIKNNEFY